MTKIKKNLRVKIYGRKRTFEFVKNWWTCCWRTIETLQATCPDNLKNKMEMRGVGIVSVKTKNKTKVQLCVQLCPRAQMERFPMTVATFEQIPAVTLPGHDVAATADKIAFICRQKDMRAFLRTAQSA